MKPRLQKSNQHPLKVLLCIAAYLPMMLGGAGTFVLCFGQGGHIAIEFAHDGAHDHSSNHLEGSEAEHHGSISDDGCNSCFDLPLTVDRTDPHTVKEDVTRTVTLLAFDSARAASVAADSTDDDLAILPHRPPPALHHSLGELGTIVLRT
jgi:hypothetical protein